MAQRVEGLTAIVTGAGGGIGRGVALTLAEEGAKVAEADIAGPDEVVHEISDLLGEASADAVDASVEHLGESAAGTTRVSGVRPHG